jgi:hypothetical protein
VELWQKGRDRAGHGQRIWDNREVGAESIAFSHISEKLRKRNKRFYMDEFENTLLVLFICMLVFVPLVLIWFRQGGKSESENAQKIRDRKKKLWQEWAATKNLTYHPPLGNPKREKNQQWLKQ